MKQKIKSVLIWLSLLPYKKIEMDNGLIVKIYRNGRMIANERNINHDKKSNYQTSGIIDSYTMDDKLN